LSFAERVEDFKDRLAVAPIVPVSVLLCRVDGLFRIRPDIGCCAVGVVRVPVRLSVSSAPRDIRRSVFEIVLIGRSIGIRVV
jgi:hypothetical protein